MHNANLQCLPYPARGTHGLLLIRQLFWMHTSASSWPRVECIGKFQAIHSCRRPFCSRRQGWPKIHDGSQCSPVPQRVSTESKSSAKTFNPITLTLPTLFLPHLLKARFTLKALFAHSAEGAKGWQLEERLSVLSCPWKGETWIASHLPPESLLSGPFSASADERQGQTLDAQSLREQSRIPTRPKFSGFQYAYPDSPGSTVNTLLAMLGISKCASSASPA